MRILVIEDHRTVAKNIRTFLEMQNYTVTVAYDGTSGFQAAMTEPADVVILDVNLPGMDGYELCTQLRAENKNMPILMLTARGTRQEMVHGLNVGADDYLTKPFDLDVLAARVRALVRRHAGEKKPVLTADDILLDTNTHIVRKNGKEVALSPKEYALLEYLLLHKGMVQDRPTILEHVWGNADALLFSNTVDVHVRFLRRKLGKDLIRTVPNAGYMIMAVDAEESSPVAQ